MAIRFQNLSEREVKQLKTAVSNILDKCIAEPIQQLFSHQLITEGESILHKELSNRSIILEELAGMTLCILDQISRKIAEHDQLQCELQNFLAKSKEACLKVLKLKEENQHLHRINDQLCTSLQILQQQKHNSIIKFQQIAYIWNQDKSKYESQIQQLKHSLNQMKYAYKQHEQKYKIQKSIIEQMSQLRVNNKSLKEHLIQTKMELNKAYQELRCSKQLVSAEALHVLSVISKKQISLEHQFKQDNQDNDQIASSLKMDLDTQFNHSPQILFPNLNLVQEIKQTETSQLQIHQQAIQFSQNVQCNIKKQIMTAQILQQSLFKVQDQLNHAQPQHLEILQKAVIDLKLNLQINMQTQEKNRQNLDMIKEQNIQNLKNSKKTSRIQHLMNVIGQKQMNNSTNRRKQKFKFTSRPIQTQKSKAIFPSFGKNTCSSIKKLTTCQSTFSLHRKDTFSTVFQMNS